MVSWGFQGATIGENNFTSASMGKIFENFLKKPQSQKKFQFIGKLN
jgi:hypothetical protein